MKRRVKLKLQCLLGFGGSIRDGCSGIVHQTEGHSSRIALINPAVWALHTSYVQSPSLIFSSMIEVNSSIQEALIELTSLPLLHDLYTPCGFEFM